MLALSIALSLISVCSYELVPLERGELLVLVPDGVYRYNVSFRRTGFVRFEANLSDDVRIYLLDEDEYSTYASNGALPDRFASNSSPTVEAVNPVCFVVENPSREERLITIKYEVFEGEYPYWWLSLIAYPLLVASIALIFIRLVHGLREELEEELEKSF